MEFASARFAGDAFLEQILNDPDTGQVKLQAGSPASAVQPVQQVLLELGWLNETDPPVPEAGFADGVWGTDTYNVTLTYKRVFRMRYPPGGAEGFIDGYVGPRTLWLLDKHIALQDQSLAQIAARVAQLEAEGIDVVQNYRGKLTRSKTLEVNVTIDGVDHTIMNNPETGTFLLRSPILDAYYDRWRAYGAPISDEEDGPPGTRQVRFQTGTLRCDLATGQVTSVEDPSLPNLVY